MNTGRPKVLLHIGLHKTGTRFLQREVFGQLDPTQFSVNPEPLWPAVRQAVRHPDDPERVESARQAVAEWRASGDDRTLVISEPHISGDMYGSHHDYADNLALMRELFPEARAMFFVRKQSDWLQSAYRQHLAKGRPVPIEVFLNFYEGEFRRKLGKKVYGSRNLDALNLRFLEICRAWEKVFGAGSVFLVRQEDLRKRPLEVKELIAGALGLEALPEPPKERGHNRSYSALAIHLFHPTVLRAYPQPDANAVGERSIPKYLKVVLAPLRRIRRVFIQHVFDKILYVDWDLLAKNGMRKKLEEYYAAETDALADLANRQLAESRRGEHRSVD
jgi:hypothetical protein